MKANFDLALSHVLKWEGGFVNDPHDPGGPTNHGITQDTLSDWMERVVTVEEVKNLKMADVRKIYRSRYWNIASCDVWPSGVDLSVFDSTVNQGPMRAIKFLQQAAGVMPDGFAGPITKEAVRGRTDYRSLLRDFAAYRALHYASLPRLDRFGLGWMRRLIETHEEAIGLLMGG